VALLTTDLSLSVEQIIEFYSVRWKIEAGFKEIKQETGSARSQIRNADAASSHLNFCMMVTTLIWIYADHLQNEPDRRREIRARARVAFSDVRIIIADVALDPNFQSVCHRLT
jgi:transposase